MDKLEYWRSVWQEKVFLYPFTDTDDSNIHSKKVLNLLSKYVGFSSYVLSKGITGSGDFFRFFSGRCRTQYASEVESAIACYFNENAYFQELIPAVDNNPVDVILSQVKREIGNSPINPNGSLAAILRVIHEQTGVDFDALNAEEIIKKHNNAPTTDRSYVLTSNGYCERQKDGTLTHF